MMHIIIFLSYYLPFAYSHLFYFTLSYCILGSLHLIFFLDIVMYNF